MMDTDSINYVLTLLPKTAVEALAILLITTGIVLVCFSFGLRLRVHTLRLAGIGFVLSLALFANYTWTYFAAIFIIATVITELDFLQNLAAIIARDPNYWRYKTKTTTDKTPLPDRDSAVHTDSKSPMELKILHTLWALQIFHSPKLETAITFGMEAFSSQYMDSEYAEYLTAVGKLMHARLISQSEKRQVFLTPQGYRYCAEHEKEFPSDRWYINEVSIDPQKRNTLLAEINTRFRARAEPAST